MKVAGMSAIWDLWFHDGDMARGRNPKSTGFRDWERRGSGRILVHSTCVRQRSNESKIMPLKTEVPEKKQFPLRRVISSFVLVMLVFAIYLALRKPEPIRPPQTKASREENAHSFEAKISQLETAQVQGESGSEVHLTADEIRAAFSQASPEAIASTAGGAPPDLGNLLGEGAPAVSFEGDQLKSQFPAEIGGKKVYVTVNGRLGSKDGYATFEPTEFKVGDLTIPVSLVKDALDKKMAEQRDRMKLPDFVGDVHVENGELVIKQK
jgi:hypothetical protein